MLKNIWRLDWILFTAALLLIGLSLAALYPISFSGGGAAGSDAANHFSRQAIFAIIGIFLFFVMSFADYRILRSMSSILFLGGIFLLLAVLVFGRIIRGTAGWINFGFFNFQPVELFKLIAAILLAKYFSLNAKTIRASKHIFISAVPIFISIVLILAQPDLGSSLVVIGAWLGILLLSGVKKRYLAMILIAGMLVSVVGWTLFLKNYQKERIMVLVNPKNDTLGAGYNVYQSTVAVGG